MNYAELNKMSIEELRALNAKLIEVINAHLDYYQIVAFDKLVTLLTKSISNAIVGWIAWN